MKKSSIENPKIDEIRKNDMIQYWPDEMSFSQRLSPGAPADYNPGIAAQVCEMMAEGKNLIEICKLPGMPKMHHIFVWVLKDDRFAQLYNSARLMQADAYAEQMAAIADEKASDVRRAQLRISTRQWIVSRLNPRKYGELRHVDISGGIDLHVSPVSKPVPAAAQIPAKVAAENRKITLDKQWKRKEYKAKKDKSITL